MHGPPTRSPGGPPDLEIVNPLQRLIGRDNQAGGKATHGLKSFLPTEHRAKDFHPLTNRFWNLKNGQHSDSSCKARCHLLCHARPRNSITYQVVYRTCIEPGDGRNLYQQKQRNEVTPCIQRACWWEKFIPVKNIPAFIYSTLAIVAMQHGQSRVSRSRA